jgi:hypothetical protein
MHVNMYNLLYFQHSARQSEPYRCSCTPTTVRSQKATSSCTQNERYRGSAEICAEQNRIAHESRESSVDATLLCHSLIRAQSHVREAAHSEFACSGVKKTPLMQQTQVCPTGAPRNPEHTSFLLEKETWRNNSVAYERIMSLSSAAQSPRRQLDRLEAAVRKGGGPTLGVLPKYTRAPNDDAIYSKSDESFIEKHIFVVAAKIKETRHTSVRCRKALLDVTVHVRKAETVCLIINR